MKLRKSVWLAGLCWLIIVLLSLNEFIKILAYPDATSDVTNLVNGLLTTVYVAAFGIVGGLILAYQPRNTIGWLMLVIGLALVSGVLPTEAELNAALQAGPTPPAWVLATIWFGRWSWWLLIGPLLLILQLFPTGHLLSPRWRWVVGLLVAAFLLFVIGGSLSPVWTILDETVQIASPFGIFPAEMVDLLIVLVQVMLVLAAILSLISVFVRYRRVGRTERQQLKWFLSSCAVFLIIYVFGFVFGFVQAQEPSDLWAILFDLSLVLIPVSIGIAILRYRLFDIDIIIRRTLTYALVTAALVIVFFGSVILLQQVFSQFTDSGENELVTVLSTLVIAALFVPLRNRIQNTIDRRFNRNKYNAQQILQEFGETVRDETDLEVLNTRLIQVVQETMQPRSITVWLRRDTKS